MALVAPQFDIRAFRLLSDSEFRALHFADRLEYLKAAIQVRKIINSQIEETLFGIPDDPQN